MEVTLRFVNSYFLQIYDGARPHCIQCICGNRTEDYEYTNPLEGWMRIQRLEEGVAQLQAVLNDLKNPSFNGPAVFLREPHERNTGRLCKWNNVSIKAAFKKVGVKDPTEGLSDIQHSPKQLALK